MSQHSVNIDDMLVAAESRYFDIGHRRTGRNRSGYPVASTTRCPAETNGARSRCGEPQATPHASALDAIIMANVMVERHCSEVLSFSDVEMARLYPVRAIVRARSESAPPPVDGLPLPASLEPVVGINPAECIFRVSVADLEVRLVVVRVDPGRPGGASLLAAASVGPRETTVEDLVLSDDGTLVKAAAQVRPAKSPQCRLGQQVSDWLQLAEALLISVQLCQLMVDRYDRTDQAESGDFRMRRVELELFPREPLSPGRSTAIEGSINRVTDVPLSERTFRSFRISLGSGHLRCSTVVARALRPVSLPESMYGVRPRPEPSLSGEREEKTCLAAPMVDKNANASAGLGSGSVR
ncbi:MAG: AvrD family protein [Micrococcales bacterium]|nr:AvrD family protein [Micrococcales bacterium]